VLQPARHGPSSRRHRQQISPEQIRLLAIAGIVLVVVIAAVLLLPVLLHAPSTQNGTGNGSASSWIPVAGARCSAGLSECSGRCVDLMTDNENCGKCGFSVPFGESCINGQFSSVVNKANRPKTTGTTTEPTATGTSQGSCPSNLWSCSGTCVDPGSDRNNCGACGTTCPSVEICQNGQCVLPATTAVTTTFVTVTADISCSRNEIACSGTCVDIFTDKKNCGVCGRKCGSEEICMNARCGPACSKSGTTLCNDQCVDLDSDMNNCGACGTECRTSLPHSKGSLCSDGKCILSQCSADYGDCDKNIENGCEVSFRTDASNCGSCGTICSEGKVCYNKKCSTPVSST
jgi:hypothetical protein